MLKMPPFAALRAFESASRLTSVSRAAEELHLTHSAISHQIKALEEYLGLKLMERDGRRIKLTHEGRSYAYQIRQSMMQIGSASERISQRQSQEHLTLGVIPSFGAHWLVPRLGQFMAENPKWRVEVLASLEVQSFDESPVDCSVRFGHGEEAGTRTLQVMRDWLVLVAASGDPRFSPRQTPLEALQAGAVLTTNDGWAPWLDQARVEWIPSAQVMQFNDSNLALEAARNGLGAVLTRWSIAQSGLASGLLQQVTPVIAPLTAGYKLVWPDRSHQSHKVLVFAEWLQRQCTAFEQQTLAHIGGDKNAPAVQLQTVR
jgi:LysR family glycine cleavage system transcriptional activator